jgi:hypothetical protein
VGSLHIVVGAIWGVGGQRCGVGTIIFPVCVQSGYE